MYKSLFEKKSAHPSDSFKSINFKGKWQKKFIDKYVDSIFEIGIDKTHEIFSEDSNEHLPKCLYKFFPPSIYSLNCIQNKNIFLSSPQDFNDPFDSFICVDDQAYIKFYILKAIENNGLKSLSSTLDCFSEEEFETLKCASIHGKYKKELRYVDNFKSRLYHMCEGKSDEFNSKVNSISVSAVRDKDKKVNIIRNLPYRITCFSNFADDEELGRNTTMWSHYAKSHTGFCVKYSLNFKNIIYSEIIKCGLLPVIYTSRLPKLTLQDFKNITFAGEDLKLVPSVLKKSYKALITKSKFWNYEKEWRLIISEDNEVQMSFNTIPFLNIDAIYLGCKINPNIKKSIVKFAEVEGIGVYAAEQSNEQFELDFFEVSTKKLKENEFYSKLYKYNRIKDESIKRRNIRLLDKTFGS